MRCCVTQGAQGVGKNRIIETTTGGVREEQSLWPADSATRDQASLQQHILACAGDGILVFGPDGNIVSANPAVERITGYATADLLAGKIRWADIIHEADRERFAASQKACQQSGEQHSIVYWIVDANGRARCLEHINASLRDNVGTHLGVVGTVRDITHRPKADMELPAPHERLHLAVSGANLGIWAFDMRTGAVAHNQRLLEMVQEPNALGRVDFDVWKNSLHPEDSAGVLAAFYAHAEGKTPIYEAEYRIKSRSGEWRWMLSLGHVVERDETGAALRMVGIQIDITERKRVEARTVRTAQVNAAMVELCETMIAEKGPDEVGRILVRHAQSLTNSPACFVVQMPAQPGAPTSKADDDHTRSFERLWRRLLASPKALIVNETVTDPAFAGMKMESAPIHRLLAVPASIGDAVLGMVLAVNADRDYTEDDAQVLEQFARLYALCIDRCHAMAALRRSEELFRAQYRSIPMPTCTWQHRDGDFFLLDLNDAALKGTVGLGPVIIGKRIQDIIPDQPGPLALLERCHASQSTVSQEMRILHPFLKRELVLNFSCAYIQPDLVLMHAEDITRRKRAEETVRRREAIMEAVARTAAFFLHAEPWEVQANQVIECLGMATQVSRAYVFENHRDAKGILFTSQRFEWVAPDATREIQNPRLQNFAYDAEGAGRIRRILESGNALHGNVSTFPVEEQAFLTPQGILSIVLVPIFVGREWWGFIGFDDCRRERAWSHAEIDALQTAAAIMGVAIQRRRAELLIAEQRLKMISSSRLSSLGELAAGVAHEVNNPLAVISLAMEQVQNQVQAGAPDLDTMRNLAAKIRRNIKRIERVVHGLRSLSRDNTDAPLERKNLCDIVQAPLDLCRTRYGRDGVDIFLDAGNEEIPVECRPTQIAQIIMNLLINAHDAVMDRPIRWIRIEMEDLGEAAQVRVSDSGGGVPQDIQERIFDPFFTTKDIGQGTGIGLSIAKAIAQNHRGDLYLDPNSENTCFVLRLPKRQTPKDHRWMHF